MKYLSAVVFLFLLACSIEIEAKSYSREQIQQLAAEYAEQVYPSTNGQKISGHANKIDTRVQIKPCEKELSLTAPNLNAFSRNLTVRVRCLDSQGWSLYVPVKMKVLVPIVVAADTIAKGDTLTSSHVKVAMVDKSYQRKNSLADAEKLLGAKAKRQILPGQAIMNNNLCFVCKGELVTIEASTKGLTVKATGYALSDGSFGDSIRVKNRSSNRIVNARVTDIGKVTISL